MRIIRNLRNNCFKIDKTFARIPNSYFKFVLAQIKMFYPKCTYSAVVKFLVALTTE